MKKRCFYSLLLGIGIGMILTAVLYEVVAAPKETFMEEPGLGAESNEIEKTLEGLMALQGQNQVSSDLDNGAKEIEMDELNLENEDNIPEEGQAPVMVQVTPGMHTESIGKLLAEKGLVNSPEEFIKMAYEKDLTRKFRTGRYEIPGEATIEEMLQMLTTRQE